MAGKTWVIGGGAGRGGLTIRMGKDFRPGGAPSAPSRPSKQAGPGLRERSLNEVFLRQCTSAYAEKGRAEERQRPRPEEEEEEEEEEDYTPLSGTWELDLQNAVSVHDLAGVRRALTGSKRNGGVPALARLLASSDSDGQTPLHLCATGGGKASAEAWSRRPALYSKAPGSSGHPASDGERIIEMLVEARARVDAPNMLGEPPLLAAVRAPAAPGLVRALLRCKADPDRLDALTGETALMEAACSGSSDLCLVLLQSRADPSCRNPQGQTAFDLAVASGNKQVAALPGLEPDAGKAAAAAAEAEKPRQEGDAAALRAAVKACQAGEVRRQLADFSPEGALAALEATDGSGRTMLHLCASAPSGEEAAEVAEALLDARACLQASDAFGRTPLEVAVEAGCSGSSPEDFPMEALETISRLLNAGSPPDYIGLDGAAASTAAGRAICALLEANGVSVDLRLEPESQQQPPQWPEEEEEEEVIDVVPEQPGGEPENVDELMRSSDAEEAEIAEAGAAKQAKVEEEEEPSRPNHAPEGQGSEAPEGRGAPEAGVEAAEQPPPQQTQDAEPVSAPSRGSKGGLRGRCEFHGIPLDKLGTFVAAPALKECERLLLLSIEELRKEAEACGLRPKSVKEEAEAKKAVGNASPEEDPERGELILRLKQVFFWKVMPMSVLQAECRSLASEVVESSLGQGSDGRALEREELIEALTVATWGGLTKKESVRDRCKAKGVPVERLADLDQASQLLEQVAELEKKPLSELKNELKRRGFAPEASAEKEALVKALTQVVACEKMPLSSLRDYCKERKLAITGDMRRAEILQFMGNKSWEARYIPVEKLPSYTVGCGLLDQADRLEARSVEDLRDNCRRRNLPFEALGKKSDLVMCLTSVAVWAQLSNAHLYGECLARGCEPDDLEGIDMRSEKPARKALEEILVRRLLLEIWKGKGIDERIKDDRVALDLFREIGNLESLDEHALKLEYGKLGYPAEAATSKAQIMDRLTKFLVWRCLSLGELKKEAQLMDASVAGLSRFKREEEQCEEMVGRLFEALVRDRWEATGVPVKRLGGMQVAAKLVEEQNSLQGLSEERTRAKYASFGMPEEVGKPESKEELCRRMCLMALWKKLSLKELTKECRELDIPPVTGNITAEELIERLSLGLCLDSWEKEGLPVKRIETIAGAKRVIERARLLKTMTEEELKAEYLKLGLPPGAEDLPNKKELLSRLKKVARWRELSVKELQRECKEEEISIGGIGSKVTDPEHHKELLDRMVLAMCGSSWEKRGVPVRRLGSMEAASKYAKELSRLESMSDEDLKRDYRAIGLPASAGRVPEREEVLSRLKLVTLWSELPIHELRKECQDNSVSLGSLSGKLEESRQEVIERLIMVLFADAWEARGLPLRKLGSIQSAVSLIRETERVNSASEEELQREYSSWNLPSDAPAPEGPREILRRLKQALLWQHMPLHELRKECQERHVSSHISSEDGREDLGQLIQRLKLAHWGPPHSRPESTGYQQRPGFSIPKGPPPRRPANHWEKPGMGIFADHDPMQAMAKQFRSLELDVGATMDDVKRSYKKLALKYHPDKNLGDAQEEAVKRFREIQESYEVLHKFFEDHPQGLPPRPKAAAGRPAGAAAAPRPGGVPWRGPPGAPGGRGGFFPYSRR